MPDAGLEVDLYDCIKHFLTELLVRLLMVGSAEMISLQCVGSLDWNVL